MDTSTKLQRTAGQDPQVKMTSIPSHGRRHDQSDASWSSFYSSFTTTVSLLILVTASGCATVDWGPRYKVRADREDAMFSVLQRTTTDPIHACDKVLPKAIASGAFADSWLFGYNELSVLQTIRTSACACKERLISVSDVPPAGMDDIKHSTLARLVAIANSPNQSAAVEKAVIKALKRRIPAADLDEIATLYEGGQESLIGEQTPVLKFQPHNVNCDLPSKRLGKGYQISRSFILRVSIDLVVTELIESRTQELRRQVVDQAIVRSAKLRQETEAQAAAEAERRKAVERDGRVTRIRGLLSIALERARKDELDEADEELLQARLLRTSDDAVPEAEFDEVLKAINASPKAKHWAAERARANARRVEERARAEAKEKRDRASAARVEQSLQKIAGIEVKPDAAESHSRAEWVVLMTIGGRGQCRQARLSGTILANLGKQNYEVLVDLPMSLWGGGDDNDGRSLHVLLHTMKTTFRSGGFMSVCTLSRYRLSEVLTMSGFRRKTLVLTEDPTP